jgi:small-conductance mechanosensitive channel
MRHAVVVLLVASIVVLLVILLAGTIPAAVISASVAAAGIIMGIAARPMLENFVSGVMMTFSGSVSVGDTVIIDERYGTIEDITLTHTVVKLWNWWRHVFPNSVLMSKDFINLTLYDSYQWCYVEFWISHEADLERVRTEAVSVAKAQPSNAGYESPRFWVMEMGKEGVRCWIAAWADNPSTAWELSNGIRTELTTRLSKLKIYPHRFNLSIDRPNENEKNFPGT